MKAKTKLTKLWSFLLSLVMLLSLLPTTALAASPDASNVFVDGGKNFYNPGRLYYKNNDPENVFTGTSTDFNAAYDPATGTLTLKDYNGKGITVGGVGRTDITVVLEGTNIINDGSLENAVGGDITVTSSDGGTLSITRTLSGGNAAIGIETGLSGSYTTGSVTIKGDAEVTIDMTHTGTSTYEKAYGIYAKENITISENASVDITCATPNNTTGGSNCNGMFANGNVSIDTTGKIKIDVTKAGKDDAYSFGIYPMGTPTLTRVGEMQVQWKKHSTHSSYPGGAISRGASFDTTTHAVNVDTINCYASYRFGTPRKVTAQNGQLTGPGVKYENGSGYFLAGDKVNITPAIKKSWDDQEIPFKEWTSSDVTLDKSATTASNSFTVPDKDVTVTAKHSPFVGTPKFTPTGTTGTQGTLTFKTVVKANAAQEGFRLVEEGNENNESSYISIRSDTTSTSSPYEYSYETSIYGLNEGNYYVVAYLNNHYYLGEKVTVSYTAPVTTYTVSFNANGGTGTMVDVTDISGEYTLPENGFTAPAGKQFKAWSVGGVEKAVGDKITVTANTTVTAVWEDIPVVTYTVSFDANGGTGSMADVTGVSGEYTLPANGFTAPAGKQFKAWSVGGVEKAVGDKITVTANTTVTAVWEDIPVVTYTVSFDANGGTGTMTDVTGVSGEYTLPANSFTAPAGKQFKAWSVGGVEKAVGDKITVTANTTVTAVWEAVEYNVTVTGGTASVGAGTPITKATMGTTVTLTAGAAPTGQMFDKWVVNGVVVDDANSATTTFVMPAGNVTAEATYKNIPVVTYTVSFDANGGTGSMADATGVSGEYTLPANGFTAPDGKQFKAWSVGGVEKAAGDKITVTANTTVTAVWEDIPVTYYTVTFDSNGGSAVTAQSIEAGQKATKPADPTKDGYDFKGWTLNGSAYDFNTAVNGNITLVATWEQQQVVPTTYTVSFAANGGTGTMADVTGISGEYTLPANGFTAPDGKQFKAWSVDGNEKAVGDKITVTADTTVTAVWETIPAGHTCDIKPVAKVEPSCTEGGKEAYYKCEGCGKFYEDALGTKEITDLASWGNLAKLGHTESDWKSDKDNHWKECTVAGCGVIIENSKAAHADANNDGKCDTCEYNVGIPTTPGGDKPNDNPQTGDNSMMWLWIALLFVSGFGVVTTTVYTKKRKSVK